MKTGTLAVWWDVDERDLYASGATNATLSLVLGTIAHERPRFDIRKLGVVYDQGLLDELTVRGFDRTTLQVVARWYQHPWMVPGAVLWHRPTGEEKRVHHVRYERGVARVMLIERRGDMDEPLRDIERRLPYLSLAEVERDWCCRPGEHPRSWLPLSVRSQIRPDCIVCGTRREVRDGALVCPKCTAEGRQPNALIEVLMDRRPS